MDLVNVPIPLNRCIMRTKYLTIIATDSNTGGQTNGSIYSPDGIDMVYVEETDTGFMTIQSFYIGKYEVTQAQYQAIMGTNPSFFKGANNPVETVSLDDIKAFISKLNAMTNRHYRLPTISEWECAAREGTKRSSYEYSGSNNIDEVAWYKGNSKDNNNDATHPVGQKQPNALGIYDMSGNVWEWCEDNSDSSGCPDRGTRGGGWGNSAGACRVSLRGLNSPSTRIPDIGFRLALSL
ncbi:hypothetical protein FACS1894199_07920 [Bacteroidia bacterium]|nr:hypothetical protein FACS1894199_07920 [Bacteroidia bacterium]